MNYDHPTDAAVLAHAAATAAGGKLHQEGGLPPILIAPDGKALSLEHLLEVPTRHRRTVQLESLQSFLAYVQAHAEVSQPEQVFLCRERLRMEAIFDGQEWREDRAVFDLRTSKELATWTGKAGTWMPQAAFAEFLEDNLQDIANPTHTDVLGFVEKLEATRKETFKSAINQTTGETSFTWSRENSGTESARILSGFTLGIPFWHRGERISVTARLQHSIKEVDGRGVLSFRFKLENPEQIKDKLWDEALETVRGTLQGEIYEGSAPPPQEALEL